MGKRELAARLRKELEQVTALRQSAAADAGMNARRAALRRFQAERMAQTHADLLMKKESYPAARFFLDDLYGAHDLSGRDEGLARIVPTMEKLLPEPALETVADAIALDALSERLDLELARALGTGFNAHDYLIAFRTLTPRADRELQIAYVRGVGQSLARLVRVPLIATTLRMMRSPARASGLTHLHEFLERGYSAFKALPDAQAFVNTVTEREQALLIQIYEEQIADFG